MAPLVVRDRALSVADRRVLSALRFFAGTRAGSDAHSVRAPPKMRTASGARRSTSASRANGLRGPFVPFVSLQDLLHASLTASAGAG